MTLGFVTSLHEMDEARKRRHHLSVHESRKTVLAYVKDRRASRYAGVQKTGTRGVWRASIRDPHIRGGVQTYLGAWRDERLASLAYNAALVLIGLPPVNIKPKFFESEHSPELQAFISNIAAKIEKPYRPPSVQPKDAAQGT